MQQESTAAYHIVDPVNYNYGPRVRERFADNLNPSPPAQALLGQHGRTPGILANTMTQSQPQIANVKKPFQQSVADGAYSLLSYSVLTWVVIIVFLGMIYLQSKGKLPGKIAAETINMIKGSLVMNAILLVIFYLAVNLYRPLESFSERECQLNSSMSKGTAPFTKFVSLLTEVSLNVLPLILTSFLGYHCLLNINTVAWASLLPAGVFLLYLSIFPIDKIYKGQDATIKIDRSDTQPKVKSAAGSIMGIIPPTLAVYAMVIGLYYYIHSSNSVPIF